MDLVVWQITTYSAEQVSLFNRQKVSFIGAKAFTVTFRESIGKVA